MLSTRKFDAQSFSASLVKRVGFWHRIRMSSASIVGIDADVVPWFRVIGQFFCGFVSLVVCILASRTLSQFVDFLAGRISFLRRKRCRVLCRMF